MKNIICLISIFVLLVMSGCGQNENIKSSNIKSVQHFDIVQNAILTKLPVFEDEKNIYYADNGKTLKKVDANNSEYILDNCENDELIQDVFVDDKYIYYSKQDNKKIDIMRIEKDDLKKAEVFQSIFLESNSLGKDFIYSNENNIYYYNYTNCELYLFSNNGLQRCIQDISCAFIGKSNIYYADVENIIYKCDLQMLNSQKIWSLDDIKQINDEYLINWCNTNINEYSVIKNLSVYGEDVYFSIHAGSNAKYGLLCTIESDGNEFDFYKNCVIKGYQLSSEGIYALGNYSIEGNTAKGLSKILMDKQFVSMNISPKEMYLSENYCYFIDDKSGYGTLYRMDLLSHEVKKV